MAKTPPGKLWMRVHLGIFVIMLALLWPTLTIWVNSVPYVVLMSWVAMAYASVSSWQAARVERIEEKKDES